jgi:hypothetical protein
MDRRRLVALLGGLFAAPGLTMAQDLTLVVVLDGDFRPIRSIAAAADLAQFQALWSSRVKQSAEVALRPDYKIDIRSAARSERWLYDPAGYVRVLSARKTPTWRLPSPAAFNVLLGIAPDTRGGS